MQKLISVALVAVARVHSMHARAHSHGHFEKASILPRARQCISIDYCFFHLVLKTSIVCTRRAHDIYPISFLQEVLNSIANAFLYYVNHFKLYSSFCASHSKAQKALNPSEYHYHHHEY